MQKYFATLLITGLLVSCNSSDLTYQKPVSKPQNIVVIGNSITNHSPKPEIGWNNDWGMAASSPDKDFCGILSKKNKVLKLRVQSWEVLFNDSDFPPMPDEHIDVLVIQLGENIGPDTCVKFRQLLPGLIARYKQSDTRVFLVSGFWSNPAAEQVKKDLCQASHYELIDISMIKDDPRYQAVGEFENFFVSLHPNDKGMQYIADKIQEKL